MSRRRVPLRASASLLLVAAGLSAAAAAAAPAPAPAPAPEDRNLLRNAGFEAGDDSSAKSWEARPDPQVTPPPTFLRPREGHEGQRCAAISGASDGGRHALVQVVDDAPRSARVARLTGWVRVTAESDPAATTPTAAALVLSFPESDETSVARTFQSVDIAPGAEWTQVELEAPVPDGARTWTVSCTLRGRGEARFDGLTLTGDDQPEGLVGCVLAQGSSRYVVEVRADVAEPWIEFSIPFPFEGQTPLALTVTSDPPDAVDHLEIRADRENRPLRVVLQPLRRGDLVRLRADSVVLLRDRPLSRGAGVELTGAGKASGKAGNLSRAAAGLPDDVRDHLQPAPGVPAADEAVINVARGFSHRDLASFTADLERFLEFKLSNTAPGRKVRGSDPVETNMLTSSEYANLAASLLIAAGVPARILACTGVSGALQEHYLVEAWTPALGWARLESTARFPWGDTRNLVLRVVYPDSRRTLRNVPLFCEADPALDAYPNFAPETLFWQSGRLCGTFAVERADVERLQAAARQAFEAAAAAPSPGDRLLFAPAPDAELADAAAAEPEPRGKTSRKAGPEAAARTHAIGERGRKLLDAAERLRSP